MDIIVANNADSGNGTLRQAIQFNESLGGGNTILFSNIVTGSITLTNLLGELIITKDVTIVGPGAKVLAISGNNAHRVFYLTNNAAVTISGLKITGGRIASIPGAGIRQDSGTLALSDCLVSSNDATSSLGGGIWAGGTVLANRCTISGNHAGYDGGGIYVEGTFTAINCTVSANVASSYGAGIDLFFGSLILTNCTISGNNGSYTAGINNGGGTATIRNTIIASNTTTGGQSPDCFGAFTSGGFNLIGAINGSSGWGALGDQVGTTNSPINPLLGPLRDNGGPTPTLAPQIGSPAVDQGNSTGILTDQRGHLRPYTNVFVSSIPLGGDRSDIGAYEISPTTLVVSNLADGGIGSLRGTLASPELADGGNVTFASNVVGSITLTTGELVWSNAVMNNFDKVLKILGPGAKILTLSGNNNSRVFHLASGIVSLADLTIANGTNSVTPFSALGGGIFNEAAGQLTVSNCAIVGNTVRYEGAGIANLGILYVYNSTIASNSAFGTGSSSAGGGGIYNLYYAWIQNSTISGNTASGGFAPAGGGVYNSSSYAYGLTLNYSTVTSNTVVNGGNLLGGGVFNAGGGSSVIDLIDSIVANNTGNLSPDVGGPFPYASFNLIGKTNGSTGITNGVNYNYAGDSAAPLDPRLGPLRDNGGPTPTHALRPDSPALDRGALQTGNIATDQRGAPRAFYFPSVPHPGPTDGSDIGAFELASPQLNIQRAAGNNAVLSWPAYYGDFALQSATNLPASNNWSAVAGAPMVVGDQFNVTNSANGPKSFFRLISK